MHNGNKRRPLEIRRADHAWNTLRTVKPDDFEDFKIQVKKLPSRILTAGLGHAMAFLEAKQDSPPLINALNDWMLNDKRKSLVEAIVKGDSDFLRRTTDEVMAYLLWLKRFVEAEEKRREAAASTATKHRSDSKGNEHAQR